MDAVSVTPEALLGSAIEQLSTQGFEIALAEWLQTSVPHDNIAILAYFQDRKPSLLMSRSENPRVHADLGKGYVNGLYLLDPFHDLHVKRVARGVYRLIDVAPDQFQRNRYFTEYYRSTTLIDEIAFLGYPTNGVSVQVCLGKDSSSNQKFSGKELHSAQSIWPIVSALIEHRWSNLNSFGEYEEREIIVGLVDAVRSQYGVSLSPRQAQVALLILRGHSSISIGLLLELSPQTVKVFRKQLYRKCGISSQGELFSLLLPLLRKP